MRSIFLCLAVAFAILIACKAEPQDEFRERDGAAEALRDFKLGKPVKVYFRAFFGVVPGWETPGFVSCAPDSVHNRRAFQSLPRETDFYEGQPRTPAQNRVTRSAMRFATAYNLAVYRLRRDELLKLCPDVQTDKKLPAS